MRRVFHHAVVVIAVFALLASAAAWRQCASLQIAAAAAEQHPHMTQMPSGHHHAAMHQHGADHAGSPVAPVMDDHGCQKCCSMCMVASALLPAVSDVTALKWTSIMFAGANESRSGNLVAVDPGIPKRIV